MNKYMVKLEVENMKVGKSILDIRKKNNLSQQQFAKQFHVTRQTVSNWENEKSYPDLQTLIEISDKYDISIDKMMKEDPQMIKKIDRERKRFKWLLWALVGIIIVAVAYYWTSPKRTEGKVDRVLFEYEYSELYTSEEFHEAANVVIEHFKTCGAYKNCELVVVGYDESNSGVDEEDGKEKMVLDIYYTVGWFPIIDFEVPNSSNQIHYWLERDSTDGSWKIVTAGEG